MDETPLQPSDHSFPTIRASNSRPSSFYDNLKTNGEEDLANPATHHPGENEAFPEADDGEKEKSPTQEFLLKTTVPQNLAATNLAGRHTPTRNSLRHSRMIVMSRTGTIPKSYRPPIIRQHRLATVLVAFQSLVGATICCLAAWLLIWTPSLRKRDNPYWSGLPLLASGTVGLLLLCCFRKDHPGTLKGYLISGIKIFSILLSLIATAASFIASVFALIHILMLTAMTCELKIQLNETCLCQLHSNTSYPIKTYHYADLKCDDVDNLFTILLIFSCVVNTLGGIIALWYVYLHCSTRYTYMYSKVRTRDSKTITNGNNK